ncbi:DUF4291 domain-containing protein [Sphingomonas alpina]|uniref:DUF4291 domain-containing protein n=1 Tax=Sphingomonas alpina TaxID=653931 RepID=A0A7H0LF41_9SPHN|nr:DUF4291 domain-containing protein [Sphingomonas alpina]QNQ08294.1 DUF4291 domain-containing protein [Sphingomonas alpina]
MKAEIPDRQIRALYDDDAIRVYQAYNDAIADTALAHGTFVSPPFKLERMTWIKPSFLWMMYRSGWASKDRDQYRVLAIDISHAGFNWALDNSCPSKPPPSMSEQDWDRLKANSPVRIQWDPERDLALQPLPHRAIQIGLGGVTVAHYVNDWIRRITDVTGLAHAIHDLVTNGKTAEARALLPVERPYPEG